MKGKLFLVEGGSGSGKNRLLDELAKEGGVVIRGIVSQNPAENEELTLAARGYLGDGIFNFRDLGARSNDERFGVLVRGHAIAVHQFNRARKIKEEGKTVFMNRSLLSFKAINSLAEEITGEDFLHESLFMGPYELLKQEVDGIILMETPAVEGLEREGMRGSADRESELIRREVMEFCGETGIKFITLDANSLRVEQEVENVRKFQQSLPASQR
ncbi:MAG: hypothetical protein WD988_02280 [Candidatus Curtissbacteria bacterium]